MDTRTRSPTTWPSSSLTVLNSSTSIISRLKVGPCAGALDLLVHVLVEDAPGPNEPVSSSVPANSASSARRLCSCSSMWVRLKGGDRQRGHAGERCEQHVGATLRDDHVPVHGGHQSDGQQG